VTACQAASAAARERPSGLPGIAAATPGVSHGDNVDLAVRPVSVATDVDLLFGPRLGWQPWSAGLGTIGYAVVMAPLSGGLAALQGLARLRLLKTNNGQHLRRPGS
jgi:hypothetical protein